METLWYMALTFVLTMYIVLDGYDLGVAILFPFMTTEEERRMVRAAIGPVWTGNEVWLIAASALLFLSFPRAYAAGFSGFYLGLIILLWLLMGRGLAFELRGRSITGSGGGFGMRSFLLPVCRWPFSWGSLPVT